MDAASPIQQRFAVDLSADASDLDARLERLLLLLPTGSAGKLTPFGFWFRREPDAFSAIAAGPVLGTALLLAEYSRRVPFLSYVGLGLSALFLSLAGWLLWRFARNALARFEVEASGSDLVLRERLGRREVSVLRHDTAQIVSVLVMQGEGEAARVVLGGPRHAVVGEVFRARHLDPERLAPWMAEMIALAAQRASLR